MAEPRTTLTAPEAASTPSVRGETVVVTPDQVWSPPRAKPADATTSPPTDPPRQSFFAPIALVAGLSAALMVAAVAALLLLFALR